MRRVETDALQERLAQLLRQFDGLSAWLHLAQGANPALGLGDDLVGDDQDVLVTDRADCVEAGRDERGQVVPRGDLRQALDRCGQEGAGELAPVLQAGGDVHENAVIELEAHLHREGPEPAHLVRGTVPDRVLREADRQGGGPGQ